MTTHRRTKGERRRNRRFSYEDEMSVRRATGTVSAAEDVWWLGELVVPIVGERAIISVERRPEGTGPSDAALVVPRDEIDALLTLLVGLVAHARRDGVLLASQAVTRPARQSARHRGRHVRQRPPRPKRGKK